MFVKSFNPDKNEFELTHAYFQILTNAAAMIWTIVDQTQCVKTNYLQLNTSVIAILDTNQGMAVAPNVKVHVTHGSI